MKSFLISTIKLMICCLLFGSLGAQSLPFVNIYGDQNQNSFVDVKFFPTCNAFFAVGTRIDPGSSLREGVLTKISPNGAHLWSRSYGEELAFANLELADNGNIMVGGLKGTSTNNYSLYMAEIDKLSGSIVWDRTYFIEGRVRSVRFIKSINDPIGESYYFKHWWSTGGSSDDTYVLKVDGSGNQLCSNSYLFPSAGDEQCSTIIPRPNGGVALVGTGSPISWNGFLIELDAQCQFQGGGRYGSGFNDLRGGIYHAGNYYLVGQKGQGSSATGILLKIDASSLSLLQVSEFAPGQAQTFAGITHDNAGNLYINGYYDVGGGDLRLRIMKYNSNLNFLNAVYFHPSSMTGFTGGAFIGHNPSSDHLIFGDIRNEPDGFGNNDAWLAVLPTTLESCETAPLEGEPIAMDFSSGGIEIVVNETVYEDGELYISQDIEFQQQSLCCAEDCVTNTLIINTGYDHLNNAPYSAPSYDAFWTLCESPDLQLNPPLPASVVVPNPAWASQANTGWISAYPVSAFNDNNWPPASPYAFKHCFCVCEDSTSVNINLSALADNNVDIDLVDQSSGNILANLVDITDQSTNAFKLPPTSSNTNHNLNAGTYCVKANLRNLSGVAMGVNIMGTITGGSLIESVCCNPQGTITGIKYNDLNCNGEQDDPLGEPGMPGWTIELNDANGNTIASTVTDGFGYYSFYNVSPGSYTVSEVLQTGWQQTQPPNNSNYNITITNGQVISNINFGNCIDACREECSTQALNISTGFDLLSNSTYPIGSFDAKWTLCETPDAGVSVPLPAYVINPHPAWDTQTNTEWISAYPVSGLNANNPDPDTPYTFKNCFCVCEEESELTFDLSVLADDYAEIDLGTDAGVFITNLLTTTTSQNAFQFPATQTTNTVVLGEGNYCLYAKLRNLGAVAMGLNISGSITGGNLIESACCNPTGSLTGQKYLDANCNGEQDNPNSEPGLSGWTITLKDGNGNPVAVATTDAFGFYTFPDLLPGTYVVEEVQQLGYSVTQPQGGSYTVTLQAGQVIGNLDFGNCESECDEESCQSDVLIVNTGYDHNSGTTYPNGAYDAYWTVVETPTNNSALPAYVVQPNSAWANQANTGWISAFPVSSLNENNPAPDPPYAIKNCFCVCENESVVQIDLSALADNNVDIDLTDEDCNYIMDLLDITDQSTGAFNLPATTSSNSVVLPEGTYCLQANVRNLSGVAMGVNIQGTITGGSIIKPGCCDRSSTITGIKYEDVNCNGLQDDPSSEPGLQGWVIELRDATGTLISSATTDVFGYYSFLGLDPGSYTVTEVQQPGWIQKQGGPYNITLQSRQVVGGIDFGNYLDPGCPYIIPTEGIDCEQFNGSSICVPLFTNPGPVQSGMIGVDYCLHYDNTLVQPTGNATVGPVIENGAPGCTGAVVNTSLPGTVCVSFFYSPCAPTGSNFVGSGELGCIEFDLLPGAIGQPLPFSVSNLVESFPTHVEFECADPGEMTIEANTEVEGCVIFWCDDTRPIGSGPSPVCNITSVEVAQDTDCNQLEPADIELGENGCFTHDFTTGNLKFSRDIPNSASVFGSISAFDAFLTNKVATFDPTFTPSPFAMVAMDVNGDCVVSAGDATLILDRAVQNISEFPTAGGSTPDWVFTSKDVVTTDEWMPSDNWPFAGTNNGYHRFAVPKVQECISAEGSLCEDTEPFSVGGILIGDADGSWSGPCNIVGPSEYISINERSLVGDTIIIDYDNGTSVQQGNQFLHTLPILYKSDDNLQAVDLAIIFDPSILEFVGLSTLNSDLFGAHSLQGNNQINYSAFSQIGDGIVTEEPIVELQFLSDFEEFPQEAFTEINALLNGNTAIISNNKEIKQLLDFLKLTPNPASDNILIDFGKHYQIVESLDILDMNGRLVRSINFEKNQQIEIGIQNLPNGVYILSINKGIGKRFVKIE